MLRCLAVLGVMLVCFTGDVSAVTDQEFQIMQSELHSMISQQAATIERLTEEVKQLRQIVMDPKQELAQNATIEERVTLLELQMTDVHQDIADINQDVTGLDEDVNFLFDEQVIQDERLLTLEQASDAVTVELVQINVDIDDLQDVTLALDFRVTELEENGGGDGNSSVSELEERVETLEGTAADHEARITTSEAEIEDLEETSAELETRITAAEENIQGLQATDIGLDARITALEENGGEGSSNETIAFSVSLTEYDTIGVGSTVEFNEILLNEGNGYDSTTGVFTVPSGGDGQYYFSTYVLPSTSEFARVDIEVNNDVICSAFADMDTGGQGDQVTVSCGGAISVVEGDEVYVVLGGATDNTPFREPASVNFNGFSGFRI